MKQTIPTRLQSYFTDPTLQRSFRGHKDTITSSIFNPNMKQVISGSEDGNVIVWNFKPQMRPYKFIGHKGAVHDVAITPNGSLIASASADETVRIWSNSVNGASQTVKAHTAPVRSVDFNNDGRLLLTGSNDKIIKVINVTDRKFQASLVGHTNWVKCARFSPDSRLVASASDDHTVKLWDVAQKSTIHTFIDHIEDVNVVKFHPDGTCIASGSVDKKIKIWDIRSKRLIQHYDAHSSSVTSISFHPSGNYLLSSSMDATLKVWDLKMGQILYTLYGHEGPATTVNFSNCGDFFCSGGTDAILMVWKSNVRNMDEEFESLNKTEMSKMKSNKRKIEEDILSGGDVNIAVPSGGVGKKSTSQNNLNNQSNNNKFKVTQEYKGKVDLNTNTKKQNTGLPMYSNINNNPRDLNSSNMFNKLPEELSSTFEKMISQLDIIAKTMKIMDQRIATVENQVTELYKSRTRKRMINSNNNYNENNADVNAEDYQSTFKSKQSGSFGPGVGGGNSNNYEGSYKQKYDDPYANTKKYQNDFRMSQNSNPSNYNPEDEYNNNNNNNYGDTFKQGRESSSTPNVFNQNLGGTVSYSTYGYSHYNNIIDIEKRDYIREVVNKEDEERRDLRGSEEIIEDEIENEENVKNLEIFEDKNNHIEELTGNDFNVEAGLENNPEPEPENENDMVNPENLDNEYN